MSNSPDLDATVEPAQRPVTAQLSEQGYEKTSFLALGRYALTDEDIHSRANVRHLMARSDALEEATARIERLQTRNFELERDSAILRVRAERQSTLAYFVAFCNSAGFAAAGYAVSFLTTPGGDKTLPVVWTVLGLAVAVGALVVQARSKF